MLRGVALEAHGEVAERVLRYVALHPGAHFREIQRAAAIGTGQADHHLHRLVREGLLAEARLGGELHFFPASTARRDRRPAAALRHPARRTAAEALLRGPGGPAELSRRTGIPASTLTHHLRVLVRGGVAWREQRGRKVVYGPSDPGWLRAHLSGRAPSRADARSGTEAAGTRSVPAKAS